MDREAFAAAKINLFLHVGGRLEDGDHGLSSLMVFADVGDRLSLRDAAHLELRVRGPFADHLSAGPENLVLRAARRMSEHLAGEHPSVEIALEKRIPVAAGLGGGSSDAGAALRLLRSAWAPDLSDHLLEEIAGGLGADGAACLWGRPVVAQGRGERLSSAPLLPQIDAVLVNPGTPVATGEVFARLDTSGRPGDEALPDLPQAFESVAELAGWLRATRNDLQVPAISLVPQIEDVLATLSDEPETLLARMSGSGATCFALCAGDYEAETLAERIEALRPEWWVKRCRLGGPWG